MSNTFAFRFGMARSVVSLDLNRYCLRLFTDERRMFVFVQFLSFKGFPTSAWELGCYALLKADSYTLKWCWGGGVKAGNNREKGMLDLIRS